MHSWSLFLTLIPSKHVAKEVPHSNGTVLDDFQSIRLDMDFDVASLDITEEFANITLNDEEVQKEPETVALELSPFETDNVHTKSSMFTKLKLYLTSKQKRQDNNSIEENQFDNSQIPFSPMSNLVPVKDQVKLNGNLFSGKPITLDDIIEQNNQRIDELNTQQDYISPIMDKNIHDLEQEIKSIEESTTLYKVEKPKIKFNAFNDVLVYHNESYPPYSPQSCFSPYPESVISPTSSGSLSGSVKKSRSPQICRKLSVSNLKPNFTRRKLSQSQTLPLQINNNLNKIDNPQHSILKSKFNTNFEAETMNTKKQDTVQVDYFMKKFEQTEFEKSLNEPNLNKLRLIQLQDYYRLLESTGHCH